MQLLRQIKYIQMPILLIILLYNIIERIFLFSY